MAVQTEEVNELIDFVPEGFLVTTVYLNVTAQEFPSPDHIEKNLDSIIHQAEVERLDIEENLPHEAMESLRADLEKIKQYVSEDFQRSDTSGLVIISCAGMEFWQVYELPTPVKNNVVIGPRPHIAPLASFLSHTKPTAILLTDRQTARIFTMKHGETREWSNFTDPMPRRSDQGGWSQTRYQRRSDTWAKHHVDHAADLVLALQKHYPFDWLILGVEIEVKHDLEESLHPYLKDLTIGTISIRRDAPEQEVYEAAEAVREDLERGLIADLMNRVQEYAGAGGRGTIGLNDTIRAMNEQRIHILLLQEGYQHPGSLCRDCSMLFADQIATCPACGGNPHQLDDVVDALIQKGFELGSVIEVATEYEQLAPISHVGSIMYY